MKQFATQQSHVIPLDMDNVNTDLIIPAQYLTITDKNGFGQYLFKRLRDSDADFVFNQERYRDARILVSGPNFGSGSSREHAVWALMQWGIDVVIAPSFADIFHSNAMKNGLVPITLDEAIVRSLIEEAQHTDLTITVDLEQQQVIMPNGDIHAFPFDPFRKKCILNGYDDINYILSHKKYIKEYEDKRKERLFYDTTKPLA